jgi:hypothetical protein
MINDFDQPPGADEEYVQPGDAEENATWDKFKAGETDYARAYVKFEIIGRQRLRIRSSYISADGSVLSSPGIPHHLMSGLLFDLTILPLSQGEANYAGIFDVSIPVGWDADFAIERIEPRFLMIDFIVIDE